ncbi:MAG: hypothetical protein RL701_2308, partial [Pseudomonadota bacterium]
MTAELAAFLDTASRWLGPRTSQHEVPPTAPDAGLLSLHGLTDEATRSSSTVGAVEALLSQRIAETDRLLRFYASEPGRLELGNTRFAYAHLEWYGSGEQPAATLTAQESSGPYDVDRALGMANFKRKMIAYRTSLGHRAPFAGSAVRVDAWGRDTGFVLSRADYLDQFVTNHSESVDLPLQSVFDRATLSR